jgi:hypothetical protein
MEKPILGNVFYKVERNPYLEKYLRGWGEPI